jgi:hypothetical protein
MYRGDHGRGHSRHSQVMCWAQFADTVGARGEIRERQEAAAPSDRGDSLEIKTGAEGAALTREHHGAQAPIILEWRVRPGDRPTHSRIERVRLGRMIQPDIGDAVGDRKLDAILDTTLSFFRLCRGGASGPARRRVHREHLCLLKLDWGPARALHVRQQILARRQQSR